MSPDVQEDSRCVLSQEYIGKYAAMWDDVEKSGKQFLLKRETRLSHCPRKKSKMGEGSATNLQ
jgi:hypothetical protein